MLNFSDQRATRVARLTVLAASLVAAGHAWGQTTPTPACIRAEAFTPTTGPLAGIPMWGYKVCGAAGPATSPGPVLTVPVGTTTFTVTLQNGLAVPTSLVINGLVPNAAPAPVFTSVTRVPDVNGEPANLTDSGTPCTPPLNTAVDRSTPDVTCRMRSMNTEVAPNGTGTYTFKAQAGTFLYQSGTLVTQQVQMGLVGALKQDTGTGLAYPGVTYTSEQILVYTEVDPVTHAAIAGPGLVGSTLAYNPKVFLINGASFSAAAPVLPATTPNTLLRLLNGGLRTRVPSLSEGTWTIVADNGFPFAATTTAGTTTTTTTFSREQATVLLPASASADVLISRPAGTTTTIFERRNSSTDAVTGAPNGMIARLGFTAAVTGPTPSVTPGNVAFGVVQSLTTSATQTVRLTNAGTGSLVVTGFTKAGADAAEFNLVNAANCTGVTLAASAFCEVTVSFAPTTPTTPPLATLAKNATLTFTESTPAATQVVALTGTATAPPPVFPALATLDTFTRANAFNLGSTWSQASFLGLAGITLNANQALATTGGVATWNGPPAVGAAQMGAAFTFASAPVTGLVNTPGLLLKTSGPNVGNPNSYVQVLYNSGTVTVQTVTGGGAAVTVGSAAVAFINGDTLGATISATGQVFVFKNNVFVFAASAPSFTGPGRIGIRLQVGQRIDNFVGGAF